MSVSQECLLTAVRAASRRCRRDRATLDQTCTHPCIARARSEIAAREIETAQGETPPTSVHMADDQNLPLPPEPVLLSDEILAPEHHDREEGEDAVDDETLSDFFGEERRRPGPPFGLECLTFTNGPLLAIGSWCIAAGILALGFWPRDPYVPATPPPGAVAGTDQPMRLRLFQDMGASDAVCMDGTSSGYYYAPATTQPRLYVLYLEGSDGTPPRSLARGSSPRSTGFLPKTAPLTRAANCVLWWTGWCYDEPSCALRCGGTSAATNRSCASQSGSSRQWPESKTFGGMLSNNASVSPVAGAHRAFLADCSSDAFIGNASASPRTFGWHLKGQAAVEAAVTSLVRDKGLGSQVNHTLVFGGASAGGMGAMLLLDHLPTLLARLGARPVRLLGFSDSAYWIDDECGIDSRGLVDGRRPLAHSTDWPAGCRMNVQTRSGSAAALGPGNFPGFAGAVQGLLQLSNAENRLSAACLAAHRPARTDGQPGSGERSDSWKCGLAHYQLPFVRSRYLMVSSLADSYQLTSNLGHPPTTEAERACVHKTVLAGTFHAQNN